MLGLMKRWLTLPPPEKRWMPHTYHFFLFIPKEETKSPEGYLFFLLPFIAICLSATCFIVLYGLYCAGQIILPMPILLPFLQIFSFYSGCMLIGIVIPLYMLLLISNVDIQTYNPSWISKTPPKGAMSYMYRIAFGYVVGGLLSFMGWGLVAYLTKPAGEAIKSSFIVLFIAGIPLIWLAGAAALCFIFSTALWCVPIMRKFFNLTRRNK